MGDMHWRHFAYGGVLRLQGMVWNHVTLLQLWLWILSLQEARTLTKARKLGVVTPALYAVDLVTNTLTFEFIEGFSVKDILLKSGPLPDRHIEQLACDIGKAIAKLHDGGLIHGDLTTSNMIVCAKTGRLVLSFITLYPVTEFSDVIDSEVCWKDGHLDCKSR